MNTHKDQMLLNKEIEFDSNSLLNKFEITMEFKMNLSLPELTEKINELITNLDEIRKHFTILIGLKFEGYEIFYNYSEIDSNFKWNLLTHFFIGPMIFDMKPNENVDRNNVTTILQSFIDKTKEFMNVKEMSKEQLFELIEEKSQYNEDMVRKDTIESGVFRRDTLLAELLKEYFNFKCIFCSNSIERDEGNPYIESHHIRHLSDGGSDTADNIAIVCPNCHKTFHFGKKSQKEKLIEIFKVKNSFISNIQSHN